MGWKSLPAILEGHETEAADYVADMAARRKEQEMAVLCKEPYCDRKFAYAKDRDEHLDRDHGGAPIEVPVEKRERILNLPETPEQETQQKAARGIRAIFGECADLHDLKNRDYGTAEDPYANVRASEDFGIPGWLGGVIRLNDKVRRLQAYARNGSLANEGVEDSLKDIITYAAISLDLFRESQEAE